MKTEDIVATSDGGARINGARINVVVTDSQGAQKEYSMPYPVTVNAATPWTKYSFSFSPSASGTAKVRLELKNATGTAWFDDIRLSPGNMITETDYDPKKNYVTSITDQENRKTTILNDKYGQPTSIASPSGEQMQYTYDGQERLLSARDNAGSTANYTLDANGNIKASSLKAGTSTYNQSSFVYDVRNNLTSETDANGKITTYKYDEGGRLTSKILSNGSTITFSYDQVDNISQVQLSSGEKYVYDYDLEGRPTNIKVYSGADMTEIKSTYDAIGNLIGYSDGSGGTVSNPVGLDRLNRITGFNLVYNGSGTSVISAPYAFTYTGNGLPNTVSVDGKNFAMIYDDGDKLINRNTPDKTQDIYTYNDANQVTGVQTVKVDANGTTLTPQWSSQYTFDADGRISAVNGTRPSGANLTESYTYNNGTEKLNRLTKAVIDGTTFNYQYDPAGNITSMGLPYFGTKTFTYDADNRITSPGFAYDNNGNLTNVAMYGTNYKYSYDSANRLTTVRDAGNDLIASYTYDDDGNRLTKTVADGTKTNYHYFQGQLMYETVGTTVTAVYLRSADGTLLGVKLNGSYYYYHYDAQGNVVAVTDSNGAVYRQYVYDPYGNIMSVKDGSGATVNISNDPGFNHAYTYRGYLFDSETGLYFLQSRYYAAGIGRFLTKDLYEYVNYMNPQSLNLYAYSNNDPVNLVDPSGHGLESVQKGYKFMEKMYNQFPGFIKNTKSFVTSYGNRIPDFINSHVVGEIKNVSYQYLSSQIKGFMELAENKGKTFVLVINEGTRLSAPLLREIERVGGKIIRVGGEAGEGLKIVPLIIPEKTLRDSINILNGQNFET